MGLKKNYNALFILTGVIILLITGLFLNMIFDPTGDEISTNWNIVGKPTNDSNKIELLIFSYLAIQVLFLWSFSFLEATLKNGKPVYPLSYLSVSNKSFKRFVKCLPFLGLMAMLNIAYIGHATFSASERIHIISIIYLAFSCVLLIIAVFANRKHH